jgi:hypothetical protein
LLKLSLSLPLCHRRCKVIAKAIAQVARVLSFHSKNGVSNWLKCESEFPNLPNYLQEVGLLGKHLKFEWDMGQFSKKKRSADMG